MTQFQRALTRRVSAIQTLGSATVLGTDKTGTLTEASTLGTTLPSAPPRR